jgi:hypothetical protein
MADSKPHRLILSNSLIAIKKRSQLEVKRFPRSSCRGAEAGLIEAPASFGVLAPRDGGFHACDKGVR